MEQTRQYAARKKLDPRVRGSLAQVKRGQSQQEATSSLMQEIARSGQTLDNSETAVLAPGTDFPRPSVRDTPSSTQAIRNELSRARKQANKPC